jgi:hypothetical protein
MTFRLEVFIEDKSLGDALRALAIIKGVQIKGCPTPVVNQEGKYGSRAEAALAILDKMPAQFEVKDLKKALAEIGIKEAGYIITRWRQNKLIKCKSKGVWNRLPHKVA